MGIRCNVLIFIRLFCLYFALSDAAHAMRAYSEPVLSGNSAVILMYHHVSTESHPDTSVSPDVFKQHMQFIEDNEYIVWPLIKILMYLSTGKRIPPKTVVLTFDDAYSSVYSEAFPILKDRGWPFTVFVTTNYIGEGYRNFMSWQQLREIQRYGGDVGNHSLSHTHFVRQTSTENEIQWRQRIINEIHQAQLTLQQHVKNPVRVVAYPYGEYSNKVKNILREMNYFGLGQQSGAVSYSTDFQAIPRFSIATGFDSIEDFEIKISSLRLPVTVLSPLDGLVSKDEAIPVMRIKLSPGNYKKEALACYASGQGRIQVDWIDHRKLIVDVKANKTIKAGRTKYNCTAPSKTEAGVFYWFSFLWMKLQDDGEWYRE
ncbi:MAG: hypothetical protein DIZ80_15155 [endosymbiont of Galathealinum brachiosum]|uniref:NodB homology domain-containing protein n=1 Tax=endosymbiont of Galathealinum brachiosum TaxID=2200906 RepID=A0A370D954_9GAMM|nr:MAG: hypothetical protein DIZ80_15155 [endosymbiont of Galathealinum brachiosum]